MPPALATIRGLVQRELRPPAGCLDAVLSAAQQAGLSKADPQELWAAICRVSMVVCVCWVRVCVCVWGGVAGVGG